jgi:hypothetical protein
MEDEESIGESDEGKGAEAAVGCREEGGCKAEEGCVKI